MLFTQPGLPTRSAPCFSPRSGWSWRSFQVSKAALMATWPVPGHGWTLAAAGPSWWTFWLFPIVKAQQVHRAFHTRASLKNFYRTKGPCMWFVLPAITKWLQMTLPSPCVGLPHHFTRELSRFFVCRPGDEKQWDDAVGFVSFCLFTFSQVEISSSLTAYVHFFLCGFCLLKS